MAQASSQASSDWERLFKACADNVKYRTGLADALESNNDNEVMSLLREIGIEGTDAQWNQRLAALKAAYQPMLEVARMFSGVVPHSFLAP